jgi:molybdopterin synthase sulfur carrier subunit
VTTLRLFAAAREAAGTGSVVVTGATVGDVLDQACNRYGADFAAVLATAKVWCNGDPVDRDHVLGEADEVAVLPPVSGGSA